MRGQAPVSWRPEAESSGCDEWMSAAICRQVGPLVEAPYGGAYGPFQFIEVGKSHGFGSIAVANVAIEFSQRTNLGALQRAPPHS